MAAPTDPNPPVRTYESDVETASVGELTSRASELVSRLVRDELTLAQLEAKQKARKLGIGAGMFGVSAVLGLLALACCPAAAILALSYVLPAWTAALVVAGSLLVLAGVVALVGRVGIRRGTPLVPTQAVENAKTDIATVRTAVHR